jgi:hypothetical protein
MKRLVPVCVALLAAVGASAQPRNYREADVQAVMEDLKREPSIQEVQKAALEFYRVDPDTVSSLRSRAAWKSIVPALRVAARRNESTVDLDRIDLSQGFGPDELTQIDDVEGTVNEVAVEGTWDLPRLVFNAEVLDVTSLATLQDKVLKDVTQTYYTRRRLQVDLMLNPPEDAASRLAKEMRVEELTATLDAVTGGLFTKAAQRERRAR